MATDISIQDLRKAMVRPDASPRARENDRLKAQAFIDDPQVKIVEKIDGTKLTLLRRNNAFDPDDYTKNWYVAYKGNIIYPGEIQNLGQREEEIRASSSGTAQYSLVHSTLEKAHKNTSAIPQGTEFFLEFVQRKSTISREYPQKHGIFLTLFGPSNYKALRGNLVSNITPDDDDKKLSEYANLLGIQTYPVLFEGNLSTLVNLRAGIRSKSIERRYVSSIDKLREAYDDKTVDRQLKIIDAVYDIFSDFDTSLSAEHEHSPAEGSVFKTSATKALYKTLRFDQHDDEYRQSVKQKFRANTREEEQIYWDGIYKISKDLAEKAAPHQKRNIPEADLNIALKNTHDLCYFNAKTTSQLNLLKHPKLLIQRQEDLFLTTKNQVMQRFEIGTTNGISIGIFVVAGKPVHAGHWEMIRLASKECDEALIITSTAGRDELPEGSMTDAWTTILEQQFHKDYPNATLSMTSDSPLNVAVGKIKVLKDVVSKFVFYSDDEDAKGQYSIGRLSNLIKDPAAIEKLEQRGVPRSETIQISGTQMRAFLSADDKKSFELFVPQTLNKAMKDKYWKILKGEREKIQDNKNRKSVLSHLWENLYRK